MKHTQCEQILAWLKEGRAITQGGADDLFGCKRLSPRIGELEKRGHVIDVEMVSGTNRYGRPTRYARYTLRKDGDD